VASSARFRRDLLVRCRGLRGLGESYPRRARKEDVERLLARYSRARVDSLRTLSVM
jgi:hypothetical protein